MIPALAKMLSNAARRLTRLPVCELAARAPEPVSPDFISRIGLVRLIASASRMNASPSAMVSRYPAMTFVSSSAAKACRTSSSLMSALLPMEISLLKPTPSALAMSRIAASRDPDCEKYPIRPRAGSSPPNEAFSLLSVAMIPTQLGPTMRIPARRAIWVISRSSFSPSGPVSRNPAEITTTYFAFTSAHCRITSTTAAAGTTITTRSGAEPIA